MKKILGVNEPSSVSTAPIENVSTGLIAGIEVTPNAAEEAVFGAGFGMIGCDREGVMV